MISSISTMVAMVSIAVLTIWVVCAYVLALGFAISATLNGDVEDLKEYLILISFVLFAPITVLPLIAEATFK